MDEKSIKSTEWRKTPIVDEDVLKLYNYFKNKRACIWDEIGYVKAHSLSKELFEIDEYIKCIENINKKLLLS